MTGAQEKLFRYQAYLTQVLPRIGLVSGIILAVYTGIGIMEITLLIAMHFLVCVSGEIAGHRMFTHRALKTRKPLTVMMGIFASMATQGPILYWVMHHRLHHQYADTEKDPHSPHFYPNSEKHGLLGGLFWAHFSWIYGKETLALSHNMLAYKNEAQRLVVHTRCPDIIKISNNYWYWVLLGLLLPAIAGGLWAGTWLGALKGMIWGGLIRIWLGQLATWGINSFSHHFGTRDFECRDKSTNNWIFAFLTWGNWHNNHHAFPHSAQTGMKWWQIDMCWYIILILEKLTLAYDVRRPPKSS